MKGKRTVSELAGAAGIFDRDGKSAPAKIAEDTLRDMQAKIGEPAVANEPKARPAIFWPESSSH